jgi:thioredoxin reductase (NADPH)
MHDIVIIGAGCAGMTAALYAARAGRSVLLLESENFGGQITFSPRVENFPSIGAISGSEFADNLFEQISALGVETELERVTGVRDGGTVKTVVTEDGEHDCKAVIIATGVRHRALGLPGEEELTGKGVSYCAVCDGAFYKGGTVAVVGGGNTALQDALFLSQYCKKVYLIHRRGSFRGEEQLVSAVKGKDTIELVLDSVVESLEGGGMLTGITVRNTVSSETKELPADGLFVAIGQKPDNDAFSELVSLDADGFIIASEDCKTSAEGIFAAGDCRTKEVRQLTTAAADGAVAALAACRYIG